MHLLHRQTRYAYGVAVILIALVALLAGCGPTQTGAPHATAPVAAVPRVVLGAGVRDVDVIVEPDDGVRMITRPIRDATRSIWLTMYLLTNRTIIHDLEYAHASGVQVRVILEPHPYGGTLSDANRYAYNNLLAADIPVHWASPRFRLTHEKSMIVDGTTAYIMTTNFTRAAFKNNREFAVVDHDARDVAALRALFSADWNDRPYAPRDLNLPVSPADARPLLTALIRSARHTLDVYAEELQDTGMERALAAAARHGVRMRVILPAPSRPDYDARGVALIRAAGVQVHRLQQSYLYVHAKAIIADGRRAFVGSENLSTASLDHNREVGVIVADPSAIQTLESTFDRDWARHRSSRHRRPPPKVSRVAARACQHMGATAVVNARCTARA
jgi:phosphatidylserine/phosphatidylglycerophosphate/cardiolipin synthase-like enzyme